MYWHLGIDVKNINMPHFHIANKLRSNTHSAFSLSLTLHDPAASYLSSGFFSLCLFTPHGHHTGILTLPQMRQLFLPQSLHTGSSLYSERFPCGGLLLCLSVFTTDLTWIMWRFAAWCVSGRSMYSFLAEGVNEPPPLSKSYIKLVASLLGNPPSVGVYE